MPHIDWSDNQSKCLKTIIYQRNYTKITYHRLVHLQLDAEQESARVRLAEDSAALEARETQLRRDQEELRRERRMFVDNRDKWNAEKDRIGKLGMELEKRAQEIDEVSLVS